MFSSLPGFHVCECECVCGQTLTQYGKYWDFHFASLRIFFSYFLLFFSFDAQVHLSLHLCLPHIAMDTVYWENKWRQFHHQVRCIALCLCVGKTLLIWVSGAGPPGGASRPAGWWSQETQANCKPHPESNLSFYLFIYLDIYLSSIYLWCIALPQFCCINLDFWNPGTFRCISSAAYHVNVPRKNKNFVISKYCAWDFQYLNDTDDIYMI